MGNDATGGDFALLAGRTLPVELVVVTWYWSECWIVRNWVFDVAWVRVDFEVDTVATQPASWSAIRTRFF